MVQKVHGVYVSYPSAASPLFFKCLLSTALTSTIINGTSMKHVKTSTNTMVITATMPPLRGEESSIAGETEMDSKTQNHQMLASAVTILV